MDTPLQDNDPTLPGGEAFPKDTGYDASTWGDYPIDDVSVRSEVRTVFEVVRRIKKGGYKLHPDFQRDFIWKRDKQSKLIESVLMRIPLPVFYMAEDDDGTLIVVDGLQRLTTFLLFIDNKFRLDLPDRKEVHGKRFKDLPNIYKNRIEDCNLTMYSISASVPIRARLDIFERVNAGAPLSRQQMRNCLYQERATVFLRDQAQSRLFQKVTTKSLDSDSMRDREFVNRFCAFECLKLDEYRGDMDEYLAKVLVKMNKPNFDLKSVAEKLNVGLENNWLLFKDNSFRRPQTNERRSVINASLWDVMSVGLCKYTKQQVRAKSNLIVDAVDELLQDDTFMSSITSAWQKTPPSQRPQGLTRCPAERRLPYDLPRS